jgi:hypothetical protein
MPTDRTSEYKQRIDEVLAGEQLPKCRVDADFLHLQTNTKLLTVFIVQENPKVLTASVFCKEDNVELGA